MFFLKVNIWRNKDEETQRLEFFIIIILLLL